MTITVKRRCDSWEAFVNSDAIPYVLPKHWDRLEIFYRLDKRFPSATIAIESDWQDWPPMED